MDKNHNQNWKAIAQNLRKPEGELGEKVAERMVQNNRVMTIAALESMELQNVDQLLEVGPGPAIHVGELMEEFEQLRYTGVDISKLMVERAHAAHRRWIDADRAQFLHTDGVRLPFPGEQFAGVVSVNTIYFWDPATEVAREMSRVLAPGGKLSLALGTPKFLKDLPFIGHGFTLYSPDEVVSLLEPVGLQHEETRIRTDRVKAQSGEEVEREFAVLSFRKGE